MGFLPIPKRVLHLRYDQMATNTVFEIWLGGDFGCLIVDGNGNYFNLELRLIFISNGE